MGCQAVAARWRLRRRIRPATADRGRAPAPGTAGRAAVAILVALAAQAPAEPQQSDWQTLRFEPAGIVLAEPGLAQDFLVTGVDAIGREVDVSRDCIVTSSAPEVVRVDAALARLVGVGQGRAEVQAWCGSLSVKTEVRVGAGEREVAVSFATDIVSILTLKGCNGSACHGSPAGQGGFKLSLFGYDIGADHDAIVAGREPQRVDLEDPERSLLLRKPTFQEAHGGGRLMEADSEEYETILSWLRQGAPFGSRGARLERLELYPSERVLVGSGAEQRMVAVGRLSDGSTRDMTRAVRYFSGDSGIAEIAPDGTLAAASRGLVTVTARAMGKVATSQIGVVDAVAGPDYPAYETGSFIDEAVFAKLRQMNVRPSDPASDREFVRRVYLDSIGLLPEPREVRAFLQDSGADKRSRLIDRLLDRPEHASHWTVRFEDWFRNCQLHSQGRSMGVFKDWVRDWLADDRPYDEFVRALLTSTGDTMLNPAANFWHPATDFMLKEFSVAKVTPTVSRLFLGVRMECAECHNHPLENYTQDDFYGLAAFFARLRVKHGYGAYRRTWYVDEEGEVEHPATKRQVPPKLLGGPAPDIPDGHDRREVLADWIVSAENPYFARATVNRVWHQYFGTGIVEPYDDFRSTNQPSNPDLLDRLAEFFVRNGYRLKPLHRAILNSRTYQLSSRANDPSPLRRALFGAYQPRRLPAEVLLDILGQVTGVPHSFDGYPEGTSAKDIYVPDGPDYFLVTFGLPRRDILKDRAQEPTLSQALHLMNGATVRDKVEAEGNILGELSGQGSADGQVVAALYERAYARQPSQGEQDRIARFIAAERAAGRTRRRAFENVLWAVLNSEEFQLNH